MPWEWGLIVFGDWIYWTSFTNNTIYRVNKESGSDFQVVKTDLRTPIGIKIYSQENQPTGILCGGQWVGGGGWGGGGYDTNVHANGIMER